jgi:hypothetical protein
MKNSILGLSILITLLCAFLLFEKDREVRQALDRAEAAEKKREAAAADAARQELKNGRQLRQARSDAFENAVAMQQLREHLSSTPADAKHKDLSSLFHDQAMREALKSEVKSGTARQIRALFDAGLAKQLNLDDSRAAALKQLLTQRSSLYWDQVLIPRMTGDLADADVPAAGAAAKQQLDDNMAQIRALIGDDGYNTLQWFEKTQAARDDLKQFSSQFADDGQGLTADQQNQLLAVMSDQSAGFKYQSDLGNASDPAQLDLQHWENNFTDDKINAYFEDRQRLNDAIVQNANSILTPQQADLLRGYLTQQLQQARFTLQTSLAMYKNQQ